MTFDEFLERLRPLPRPPSFYVLPPMRDLAQQMPFVMSVEHSDIFPMFQLLQAYAECEDQELQGLINRLPPPPRTNVYLNASSQPFPNRLRRCLTTDHFPYGQIPAALLPSR